MGRVLALTGIALTLLYAVFTWWLIGGRIHTLQTMGLNEVGDFLAGAFGPVAILWLILGFFQQGIELRQGTEALLLQAKELQSSVEQQKELVAVTREQVNAELEAASEAKSQRTRAIRPFLVPSGGGGSHSGNEHELNFTIKNLGAPISHVVMKFEGDMTGLDRAVDLLDKGGQIEFKYRFTGTGEGLADSMTLSYLDADHNPGVAQFNILVDTSATYPRIKVSA
ncbi:hypothetical protein [Pseudomonas chlororaphis]|uniref:hypothetical protein n=1 Tax=Pseudomonas chlororaphis TaxID=587753 RepID=UPI00046F99FB|nr:hypothetical protein [Pseudomonas chlororaphis]